MTSVKNDIRTTYTIHGISVTIETSNQVILKKVCGILDHFGLEKENTLQSVSDINFTVNESKNERTLPEDAIKQAEQDGITIYEHDEHYYFVDHKIFIHILSDKKSISIDIDHTLWNNPEKIRKDLIIYSILFILRWRSYFTMHSAAVAKNGKCCVFVAPSDSGKSTNAMSLVQKGWDYISDDSILLRQDGDQLTVLPLRRDLCLDACAADYFPELVPHWETHILMSEPKQRVSLKNIYGSQIIDKAIPTILIFNTIVDQPTSSIEPCSAIEAQVAMIQQSAFTMLHPEKAVEHMNILKSLIKNCAIYKLYAGHDLKEDPTGIDRLITPLFEESL